MNCIFCDSKMNFIDIFVYNCSNVFCKYMFTISKECIYLRTSWVGKQEAISIEYNKKTFECEVKYLKKIINSLNKELSLKDLKEMLLTYESNLIFM